MRPDMYEIIIERPRHQGWGELKGRRKELARHRAELSPRREPMSIGRGTKTLNENLAPLFKFLLRRVGKPWNKVHSEMCARIAPTSAVQKHVLDHVRWFVATHVVLIDGVPHWPEARGSRRDKYLPVRSCRGRALYVCPRTGLLKQAPRPRRRA